MISTVRTLQGDTWDAVAKRCLGDERLGPAIMELNFSCRETGIFPEGVLLTLPETTSASVTEELNLPPWKR